MKRTMQTVLLQVSDMMTRTIITQMKMAALLMTMRRKTQRKVTKTRGKMRGMACIVEEKVMELEV